MELKKSHFDRILLVSAAEFEAICRLIQSLAENIRGLQEMRKTLCASAVALAMAGLLPGMPVQAAEFSGAEQGLQASIDIERVKSALKLTPEQMHHWAPVEAALRDLARHQAQHYETEGFVKRVSHRAVSVVLTARAIERLAVAARPLVRMLSDEQKQVAMGLAQEMGLGPVMAQLN